MSLWPILAWPNRFYGGFKLGRLANNKRMASITMLSGIQENVIELSPATVAEADPP
jgi:hypothetical protein